MEEDIGIDKKKLMEEDIGIDKKKKISNTISWSLAIFFILVSGGLIYLIISITNNLNKQINDVKQVQTDQFVRHTETNQFLLSTIDWSTRRAQLTLFMRDQIIKQWKSSGVKMNLDEAYLIAEVILKECDNYSYIDPFLILATQCIESNYIKNAVSPMGAIGINQIMSSTGRLIAGYFGMEYSDSLLYDINISTKFSVKLFDMLYTQYRAWDVSLADYNGGPWQAYYYKNKKDKLDNETRKYIPDVLNKKSEYDTLFVKYRIEEKIKETVALEKLAYK